jgi:hypothetical protein
MVSQYFTLASPPTNHRSTLYTGPRIHRLLSIFKPQCIRHHYLSPTMHDGQTIARFPYAFVTIVLVSQPVSAFLTLGTETTLLDVQKDLNALLSHCPNLRGHFAGFLDAPLKSKVQEQAARYYLCTLTGLPITARL